MKWVEPEISRRDELITQVRRGEITPEQAEAEASKLGFGPIAHKPDSMEFDPSQMPWWSWPMALAWIAWRDVDLVREHCAEYQTECLLWSPGSWNVPKNGGIEFEVIHGFKLERWKTSNTALLCSLEKGMIRDGTMPASTKTTIDEAEKKLLQALGAKQLVAVAKDGTGKPIEIPSREWPYLSVFVENERAMMRDVLKYDDLDREPAFREVKLNRGDLLKLWPGEEPASLALPADLPPLRAKILATADALWPDGKMPVRKKERNSAIRERIKTPVSDKTIQRAFARRE